MKALTEAEISLARHAAEQAMSADSRGDVVTRDLMIDALWVQVGYWRVSRNPSTAEFRGEIVPPKMLRMPFGRSVAWKKRWNAVEAWASY